MKNTFYLIVSIMFALLACKKDISPITLSFSGFTETDEYNLVLHDDSDDWRPRCKSGL